MFQLNRAVSLGLIVVVVSLVNTGLAQQSFQVALTLEATDMNGQPISSIGVNQNFLLRVWSEDVRDVVPETGGGVFAAYMDIDFSSQVNVLSLSHVEPYTNLPSGSVSNGMVDEFGAFSNQIEPIGLGKVLVGELVFQSLATGTAEWNLTEPDEMITHDILLYGDDNAIPLEQVSFGSASLQIVPEPSLGVGVALAFGWLSLRKRTHERKGRAADR